MAIARGAGTEIIRSAHLEYDAANTTDQTLIYGVQHHIYTVLSVICSCVIEGSLEMYLNGYDSIGGTTNSNMTVFQSGVTSTLDTFVWNDKFSFNGAEPANFTGPMDDATKQNAIADQDDGNGSYVAQQLRVYKSTTAAKWDITVTYIDQNNA
jgi:hypothetical protein